MKSQTHHTNTFGTVTNPSSATGFRLEDDHGNWVEANIVEGKLSVEYGRPMSRQQDFMESRPLEYPGQVMHHMMPTPLYPDEMFDKVAGCEDCSYNGRFLRDTHGPAPVITAALTEAKQQGPGEVVAWIGPRGELIDNERFQSRLDGLPDFGDLSGYRPLYTAPQVEAKRQTGGDHG